MNDDDDDDEWRWREIQSRLDPYLLYLRFSEMTILEMNSLDCPLRKGNFKKEVNKKKKLPKRLINFGGSPSYKYSISSINKQETATSSWLRC